MRHCASRSAILGAALAAACLGSAAAQTESVILNFGHHHGRYPDASLLMDGAGHFFGTTELGGAQGHFAGGKFGVVFELARANKRWTVTLLHTFDLGTGGFLTAPLIMDDTGTLYGTGSLGGSGCGLAFALQPHNGGWTETDLHDFGYNNDGCYPNGALSRDAKGNLYGVAGIGGAHEAGMVFELSSGKQGWTETDLYDFTGAADGNRPRALLLDPGGALFGVAGEGGTNNDGVIYQLVRSNGAWNETVLHDFGGNGDGTGNPYGALSEDGAGNIYGTTIDGGAHGQGSVYELSPSNGGWSFATLYSFTGSADGQEPQDGVTLAAGALYGTTSRGGADGGGNLFELTNNNGNWVEKVVHDFAGGLDGSLPYARPIVTGTGTIYGTTVDGGNEDRGVVYQITP